MHGTEIRTLQVPGATLHYEVRGTGPLLLMIPGAPADAGALTALAACLADRYTVVTYDQRGLSRSVLTGPPTDTDVAVFADDAHRLVAALGDEPAYVLGNSGGALTALDLAARHPEQVRALVVHEPPLPELLPDRDHWRAAFQDVYETYRVHGAGAAMGRFISTVDGTSDAPPEMTDPSGMPPEALEMMGRIQGNLDHFLSHVLLPVLRFSPDIAALNSRSLQITIGVGATSGDGVPAQSARVLGERLGVAPITFPGDHQGLATAPTACADIVHTALDGSTPSTPRR
ncbi:alpha/beta fold hydrolase [Spirillospora sp. NPDC052242]